MDGGIKEAQGINDNINLGTIIDQPNLRMVECCATCYYRCGWQDGMKCDKYDEPTVCGLKCDSYKKIKYFDKQEVPVFYESSYPDWFMENVSRQPGAKIDTGKNEGVSCI